MAPPTVAKALQMDGGLMFPIQVRALRKMLGKAEDAALIQLDGAGLKVLFSRGIRRLGAQQFSTREPRL